jgi:hypothetical protein
MKNVIRTLTVVCYLLVICLNSFWKIFNFGGEDSCFESDTIKPVKSASGPDFICAPVYWTHKIISIYLTSKYAGTGLRSQVFQFEPPYWRSFCTLRHFGLDLLVSLLSLLTLIVLLVPARIQICDWCNRFNN